MFVVSRRNIVLPGPNGERFRMEKDYMGPVPAWAEDSAYLKALAADGKVILSERGTDPLTKATERWGDLNATQYGQLLATKARLVGMGGTYVI